MARITRYMPTRLSPLASPFESDFGFTWPVARLHQEMNRLFNEAFRGLGEGDEEVGRRWIFNPVVDVQQQDNQYEISVELPGVRSEDVNVEATDDMLIISGTKERKETRGEGDYRQSERMYGRFERSFRLPDDAVRDNIQAHFSDGVLTVVVPRDESQSRSRRIEVQRAEQGRESPQQIGAGEQAQEQPEARH